MLFLGSAGLSLPAQGLMSPWTAVVFTSSPASHWGQPHLSLQPSVHFVDQDEALSVLHHLSPQELSWVVFHHLWRCVPRWVVSSSARHVPSCSVVVELLVMSRKRPVWTCGRVDGLIQEPLKVRLLMRMR